ncbi:diaminopimelate epimerase [Priestia aryabhattai]|uniref:diaminopimelate epimerase n=1 Tax=Priestia aryabhattai TaxID=412384 RepID=UPI002E23B821|nr:diaminopimelate epimerase [Priestia aryabhattai]MED4259581.1 diaminopimelate epimerase [Priestia aryabhattai]
MEEYSFRFYITDSYPLQNENDKIEAVVRTKIKHAERGCLYEGYLRVHITKIGVFPVAKDIAEAIGVRSLRQKLAAELKRYVRPHRNFL